MTKRFVTWSAVSSLPQVEKVSLEHQGVLARQAAEKHGGRLIAELVVPGESRDIVLWESACREIDAYARLRDFIQSKAFDVLVFLNRSRLGRTAALVMAVEELCRRADIVLYDLESPPHSLDVAPTSHADLLIAAIKSVGAQNEIIELKRRHAMGMVDRAHRGLFPRGFPPWGWFQRGEKYEINPQAQQGIAIMIDLYLNHGAGFAFIAGQLNAAGIPAPKGGRWEQTLVNAVMTRIWTYAGYAEINRKSKAGRPYTRAKGKFPALIDEETAKAVEAERKRRADAKRAVGSLHRFSQCIWCSICRHRMNAGYRMRSGKISYDEYRCHHRHVGGYVTASRVIAELSAAMKKLAKIKDLSVLIPTVESRTSQIQALIAEQEAQIVRYQERLDRATDSYIDGMLNVDSYRRQQARIKNQIEEAKRRIKDHQQALLTEAHRDSQLTRLQEVVELGSQMLIDTDLVFANAWFRQHVAIWAEANKIVEIQWL